MAAQRVLRFVCCLIAVVAGTVPPARAEVVESPPLFYCTDAADGIWTTKYVEENGAKGSFQPPARYTGVPNVAIGSGTVTFPLYTFAAFQRSGESVNRIYATSGVDFFEFDGIGWARRGALGGSKGNNISASTVAPDGSYWMTGNPDPSGTVAYDRSTGDTVRQFPTYSAYGRLTVVNNGSEEYALITGNPPFSFGGLLTPSWLYVYRITSDGSWELATKLTADELLVAGKPLEADLHPAFTSVDKLSMHQQITIGWSIAANTGAGYKTRFVRLKFDDLLKHTSPDTLPASEIGAPTAEQLHGMTVLFTGDIVASFYGGKIRNVTKNVELTTGSGYVKWIQQAIPLE